MSNLGLKCILISNSIIAKYIERKRDCAPHYVCINFSINNNIFKVVFELSLFIVCVYITKHTMNHIKNIIRNMMDVYHKIPFE